MDSLPLPERVQAVLFDVDGTLYRQGPLRTLMLAEMARALAAPRGRGRLLATFTALRRFRRLRERLRDEPGTGLERRQYAVPGPPGPDELARLVREWMHERPLRHLSRCRRAGLESLLGVLAARGVQLGVFSDYPPARKLDALGLGDWFGLQLCATDPGIDAFKPAATGLLAACRQWGLAPERVLYVGDRPEVDVVAAARAGMAGWVVTGGRMREGRVVGHAYLAGSFPELHRALDPRC